MEYLVSADAQKLYADVNFEYPVRIDVPPSARVAAWGRFQPDSIALTEVDRYTKRASALLDEVAFNRGPQAD